jgi:hypothetical protein
MKKIIIIIAIAVTHFSLSVITMAYWVADSYNRHAIHYIPQKSMMTAKIISAILFSPLALFKSSFSDDFSLLLAFAVNSFIWGVGLYYIGSTILKKIRKWKHA